MKKEILIFGIIFLFIGVGIQPAFANENISIDRPSENIDECNCQIVDNYKLVRIKSLLNRAESLLNKVEIFTKLIPILSKDNPKVIKDCEELSEKIKPLKERYEEFNSDSAFLDDWPICDILWKTAIDSASIMYNLSILMQKYPLLIILLYPIHTIYGLFFFTTMMLILIVFPQCL